MEEKKIETKNWHNLSANDVIAQLGSDRKGLSGEEARERLARFGPNELTEKEKATALQVFTRQFKNFLIILLLTAATLSIVLGDITDFAVIMAAVIFSAVLGFVQEYRAERALEALKRMTALTASVVRDGKEAEIPARELVSGDILLIRTGDKIAADARIIESVNLRTDEAPLTGESVPVEKTSEMIEGEATLSDRRNLVFMGTTAVYGRGTSVVTSTGMGTEFGKIAAMLQDVQKEQTPLQVSLDRLAKVLGIGVIALCSLLVGIGIARGHSVSGMLIWGMSLIVAAVPGSLPAVVTISLALGVRRMVKVHALIKRLSAVETLGCTTVICSDKTGTLTQGQMTVRQIYAGRRVFEVTGTGYEPSGEFRFDGRAIEPKKESTLQLLLQAGALCNDTSLVQENGRWEVKGDPTEGALVVVAAKAEFSQKDLAEQFPRVGEIPFTSEAKRMTTLHQAPEGRIAYSKGAVEIILASCARELADGTERELSPDAKRGIIDRAHTMASEALRVLAVAYKPLSREEAVSTRTEQDLVFLGLVGMIDPPREEVKDAIRMCDEAGIKSVMITGDHKLTAVAIAKELGLLREGVSITGTEVDDLKEREFDELVERIEVYARVSPTHKLRVVEAFVKRGHVVAMTGDGVNDAPALKKADIGIAMGITGTDVSKESANMVLTDDNFASIVAAVKEGRVIFSNIKKYLVYILSCNLGEVSLMAIAVLLGPLLGIPSGVLPLLAIQILYVNLATDGFPAIALSVEPPESGIMRQKPRRRDGSVFTGPVIFYMVCAGLWKALVCTTIFLWMIRAGRPYTEAQSLCFVTLILLEFFNALNCRSLSRSLFAIGLFTNKWLVIAIVWECMLLAAIVYLPFLQRPLHTYSLSLRDWGVAAGAASTLFILVELSKLLVYIFRKNRNRGEN